MRPILLAHSFSTFKANAGTAAYQSYRSQAGQARDQLSSTQEEHRQNVQALQRRCVLNADFSQKEQGHDLHGQICWVHCSEKSSVQTGGSKLSWSGKASPTSKIVPKTSLLCRSSVSMLTAARAASCVATARSSAVRYTEKRIIQDPICPRKKKSEPVLFEVATGGHGAVRSAG